MKSTSQIWGPGWEGLMFTQISTAPIQTNVEIKQYFLLLTMLRKKEKKTLTMGRLPF